MQCPVDFLAPLVLAAPERAWDTIKLLMSWGINRFSVSWAGEHARALLESLEDFGCEVNLYAVPDLEAFLRAALMLPTSITTDFNFPAWHYFGGAPASSTSTTGTRSTPSFPPPRMSA